MLRVIGLAFLVLASGLAGCCKAAELKLRISLLEDFYKMLLTLKGQMNYFHEPLFMLLERAEKKSNSRAYRLLQGCYGALKERSGPMDRIWSESVHQIYRGTPLSKEDLELIRHPGTFIGQTDYENQAIQFAYLEQRLAEQIGAAKELYQKNGPMYRRIGFFGGAIAALVVW